MTKPRFELTGFLAISLLLVLPLAGCGGGDDPASGSSADRSASGDRGDAPIKPGAGDGREADPDPEPADVGGALVGRWVALSQDGYEMPENMLVFTYHADGTGVVVEEESSTKDFTWVYDAEAGTLKIDTENEDLNFNATLEGDRLSLVHEEPPMQLVMMRRDADAAGSNDGE